MEDHLPISQHDHISALSIDARDSSFGSIGGDAFSHNTIRVTQTTNNYIGYNDTDTLLQSVMSKGKGSEKLPYDEEVRTIMRNDLNLTRNRVWKFMEEQVEYDTTKQSVVCVPKHRTTYRGATLWNQVVTVCTHEGPDARENLGDYLPKLLGVGNLPNFRSLIFHDDLQIVFALRAARRLFRGGDLVINPDTLEVAVDPSLPASSQIREQFEHFIWRSGFPDSLADINGITVFSTKLERFAGTTKMKPTGVICPASETSIPTDSVRFTPQDETKSWVRFEVDYEVLQTPHAFRNNVEFSFKWSLSNHSSAAEWWLVNSKDISAHSDFKAWEAGIVSQKRFTFNCVIEHHRKVDVESVPIDDGLPESPYIYIDEPPIYTGLPNHVYLYARPPTVRLDGLLHPPIWFWCLHYTHVGDALEWSITGSHSEKEHIVSSMFEPYQYHAAWQLHNTSDTSRTSTCHEVSSSDMNTNPGSIVIFDEESGYREHCASELSSIF
ncbi:hypothetical protein C8J56DRAFT_884348 [Mycena floridula]|nr:hypothetical protein C8J56DRAFT_884348 [Mycena floridula]